MRSDHCGYLERFLIVPATKKAAGTSSRTDQIYLISDLTVKFFLWNSFRSLCYATRMGEGPGALDLSVKIWVLSRGRKGDTHDDCRLRHVIESSGSGADPVKDAIVYVQYACHLCSRTYCDTKIQGLKEACRSLKVLAKFLFCFLELDTRSVTACSAIRDISSLSPSRL